MYTNNSTLVRHYAETGKAELAVNGLEGEMLNRRFVISVILLSALAAVFCLWIDFHTYRKRFENDPLRGERHYFFNDNI